MPLRTRARARSIKAVESGLYADSFLRITGPAHDGDTEDLSVVEWLTPLTGHHTRSDEILKVRYSDCPNRSRSGRGSIDIRFASPTIPETTSPDGVLTRAACQSHGRIPPVGAVRLRESMTRRGKLMTVAQPHMIQRYLGEI